MLIENAKSETTNTLPTITSEKMGVDDTSPVFLMKAITENLYQNPPVAAARELMSNAFDSRTRAGCEDPIEVTLPTLLSPTLVVEDKGTGMSGKTITMVYKNVFASDKRESNEERGGYGLGSKSPLAVAASFSVVSRHNGEERVIIVARDEDNIPVFHTVVISETDEPNGVTVSVPMSQDDVKEIDKHAARLTLAQPKDSVLVNGQWPEESVHNPEQYIPIGDLGWFKLSEGAEPLGEVLGVVYDLPADLHGGILSDDLGKRAVLRLPNSKTKLETSREAIRTVTHNRELITGLARQWREAVLEHLQEHVNGLDRREAFLFAQGFSKSHGLSVAGEEIPRSIGHFDPTAVAENLNAQQESQKDQLANPDVYVPQASPFGLYKTTIERGTRPSATRIPTTASTNLTPSSYTRFVIVKTDDDAESKRLALRDLKDYELSRFREEGSRRQEYFLLTEPNGSMLSQWFLAFADFLDLHEVEEVAKEERRTRRREAAIRRANAPAREPGAPKEPRVITFSVLDAEPTSGSNRARLEATSTPSEALTGKVAYISPLPDDDETVGFAYDLGRITNRTGRHPGRTKLVHASLYVSVLHRLGYTVVALRQSQTPELLEELEGVDAVDALDLQDEAYEAITKTFQDTEKVSSVFKQQDRSVFDILVQAGLREDMLPEERKFIEKLVGRLSSGSHWREDDYSNLDSARTELRAIGYPVADTQPFLDQYQRVLDARISRRYPLLTNTSRVPSERLLGHIRLYVQAVDSVPVE